MDIGGAKLVSARYWFYFFREAVLLGVLIFLAWFIYTEFLPKTNKYVPLVVFVGSFIYTAYLLIGNTRHLISISRKKGKS